MIAAFDARIDSIDFENAKQDVLPYLNDPTEVEIWSRDFFKEYIRRMKVQNGTGN